MEPPGLSRGDRGGRPQYRDAIRAMAYPRHKAHCRRHWGSSAGGLKGS
ncbi:hypothetical protein SAMN05444161_4836 [Rhizobiales bacterium GAS191]|nr:hypothetical protein SAMN05444161_4836 [Rhizobiales bacterium GAS191]